MIKVREFVFGETELTNPIGMVRDTPLGPWSLHTILRIHPLSINSTDCCFVHFGNGEFLPYARYLPYIDTIERARNKREIEISHPSAQ